MRYEIDSNRFGPLLKVRGQWNSRLEALLEQRKISQLHLRYSDGWRGADVEFLKRLPHLEGLWIHDPSGLDISAVSSLAELKRLDVMLWSKPSKPVQFEKLISLESCEIEWNAALESVLRCASLKRLLISDMKGTKSLDLTALNQLEEFWLTRAYGLTEIALPKKNRLRKMVLRRVHALKAVDSWVEAGGLVHLWLDDCKKLAVACMVDAQSLRELDLVNMGQIKSLRFVEELPCLERIRLFGSTRVQDGDLKFLARLPNLKGISFPPQKHYNATPQEINKTFIS